MLKLILDCPPDAAWAAVRSPDVFRAVSAPFTTFESLEQHGFPASWSEGEHPVFARAFGVVPMGEQTIDLTFFDRPAGVHIVRDTGRGLSGPLALVTRWDHRMAVSPAAGGKTLFRDQLIFEVGAISALAWPAFWAFWQWRGIQLMRLAPSWQAA